MTENLVNNAGCPVYFLDFEKEYGQKDYCGGALFKINPGIYQLSFNSTDIWIEIDVHQDNNRIINGLTHEVQHAICFLKKCICFEIDIARDNQGLENHWLAEFHADYYSLKYSKKHNLIGVIKDKLCSTIESVYNKSTDDIHSKARRILMKTMLWKECAAIVESNNP